MNVRQQVTVILRPFATIPKAVTAAYVKVDTQGMAKHVTVNIVINDKQQVESLR